MVRRLAWLFLCCLAVIASVGAGGVLAALAWRGLWVQSCEGDVAEYQRAKRT